MSEDLKSVRALSRFMDNVDRGDGDPNACWNWTGCTANGYGQFHANDATVRAHRYAWELENGPIERDPDDDSHHGPCVFHTCRNKLCCNPKHLLLGKHDPNLFRTA